MSAPGNIVSDPILSTLNQYQQPYTIPNAQRIPGILDVQPANTVWQYIGTTPPTLYITPGAGNWFALGSGNGTLSTLSGDTGVANATAGNIQIAGTVNEITTAAAGSIVTLSIPVAFVAPGSITSTTGMTATNGDILATHNAPGAAATIQIQNSSVSPTSTTQLVASSAGQFDTLTRYNQNGVQQWITGLSGADAHFHISATGTFAGTDPFILQTSVLTLNCNLNLVAANSKLFIQAGTPSSASVGQATLVNGTVTVSTTNVNPASFIYLTRAGIGATGAATLGFLTVGTIVASTSFVINAVELGVATTLQTSDQSVVNYWIIN